LCPLQRGDNHKIQKWGAVIYMYLYLDNIYFSRTSRLISIKLGTNYSWVKDILNFSNKWPGPLQRGDNHKKLLRSLKIVSLRTNMPE
jgi:hypothetical protein